MEMDEEVYGGMIGLQKQEMAMQQEMEAQEVELQQQEMEARPLSERSSLGTSHPSSFLRSWRNHIGAPRASIACHCALSSNLSSAEDATAGFAAALAILVSSCDSEPRNACAVRSSPTSSAARVASRII